MSERTSEEYLKHLTTFYNHKFWQLEQQQISDYYQIWILVFEAFYSAMGVIVILYGSIALYLNGLSEAIAVVKPLLWVTVASTLILTVFIRVVYRTTTFLIQHPTET